MFTKVFVMLQPKLQHFLINPVLKYAQPVYLHQEYATMHHIQVRTWTVFWSEFIIIVILGRDGVVEERLSSGWTVRGCEPGGGGGKTFFFRHPRPDRLRGPTQLSVPWTPRLFPGGQVAGPGSGPGRGVDHPPTYSAEVKERIELYLCSPSVPAWHVTGITLTPLTILNEFLLHQIQTKVFVFQLPKLTYL